MIGAIKQCGRCGQTRAHHSDVDKICMQCERELYYPDDGNEGLINLLESCTFTDHSIEKFKQTVESYEPPSLWQTIKGFFR